MSFTIFVLFFLCLGAFFRYKSIPRSLTILSLAPLFFVLIHNEIYMRYFWQPTEGGGAPMEDVLYFTLALPGAIFGLLGYGLLAFYITKKKLRNS
jgi:hypothetical protein